MAISHQVKAMRIVARHMDMIQAELERMLPEEHQAKFDITDHIDPTEIASELNDVLERFPASPEQVKQGEMEMNHYAGTEDVKLPGAAAEQTCCVYEFETEQELHYFLETVGGIIHPLGGLRVVISR